MEGGRGVFVWEYKQPECGGSRLCRDGGDAAIHAPSTPPAAHMAAARQLSGKGLVFVAPFAFCFTPCSTTHHKHPVSLTTKHSYVHQNQHNNPNITTPQNNNVTGTIGHVAHGKSTVVKAISGVQTVRFKNELERNITIKLGYANAKIYKCPSCERPSCYRAYGSSKVWLLWVCWGGGVGCVCVVLGGGVFVCVQHQVL